MGLYSTLQVNISKLPATKEEKKHLKWLSFQTKWNAYLSLDYYITRDGYLECDNGSNRIRICKLTDVVEFHTDLPINGEYFEFMALFKNGRLVEIIRANGAEGEKNSKLLYKRLRQYFKKRKAKKPKRSLKWRQKNLAYSLASYKMRDGNQYQKLSDREFNELLKKVEEHDVKEHNAKTKLLTKKFGFFNLFNARGEK